MIVSHRTFASAFAAPMAALIAALVSAGLVLTWPPQQAAAGPPDASPPAGAARATMPAPASALADQGLVAVASAFDVPTTVDRLVAALEAKGVTVFARIDHAAAGALVDQGLPPTQLVIFGTARLGTPLMRCARSVGIDLPLKALVWQDDAGAVWLVYNDPAWLGNRHGLVDCAEPLTRIGTALAGFVAAATGTPK